MVISTPGAMNRPFVVISGIPASGKTTVARHLATILRLPLIDKDDILEDLFERKGIGDAAWRRRLSRESDLLLQAEAAAAPGAVIVSFWRVPGMPAESGTPTKWLWKLTGRIVHVRCICPADVAAARFVRRRRHRGHLDDQRSYAEVLATLHELTRLGSPELGQAIDIDTSGEAMLEVVERVIREALHE